MGRPHFGGGKRLGFLRNIIIGGTVRLPPRRAMPKFKGGNGIDAYRAPPKARRPLKVLKQVDLTLQPPKLKFSFWFWIPKFNSDSDFKKINK